MPWKLSPTVKFSGPHFEDLCYHVIKMYPAASKEKSLHKLMGTYQKNTEASLKELPWAKSKII